MWGLTQKHENKINVQEVREADRGANHFSQRNAEEFRFIKDGDGLDHCKSYVGLRDKSIYNRVYKHVCMFFISNFVLKKKEAYLQLKHQVDTVASRQYTAAK